jgi:proline dehydrogenase
LIDRFVAASIGLVPKFIVRKVAARYVAGATLDEAMATGHGLVREGCCCTFDLLGEFVSKDREADATAEAYIGILDRIQRDGLDANISIKLTAFGLKLDPEQTYGRVASVVSHARDLGNFVRIDMEDSSCTTLTLDLYRRLRREGFTNVGIVLQAYMRRTLDDVSALASAQPNYRLCKGIYVEPAEVAFKDDEEIRENYRQALRAMLAAGSYVGIATHDEVLIADGEAVVLERGLPNTAYEFQMLLGVTEATRRRLVSSGHRLRVYVPFGQDWYAYCVRRLKENPRIGRYVLLGMFRSS